MAESSVPETVEDFESIKAEPENKSEEKQEAAPAKAKPAKTTKAKKSVVTEVEQAVAKEVETLIKDAGVETSKVVSEAEKFAKDLEGKTVDELRQLRENALYEESEIKRQLHLLRLRAANMATTAEADVDHEIVKVKKDLAVAVEWLLAVEKKLEGEFKDISGVMF